VIHAAADCRRYAHGVQDADQDRAEPLTLDRGFSLGRQTTAAEINAITKRLAAVVARAD
jgi:hypothetical protein